MVTPVTLREVVDDDLEVLYQNQADPESVAMAGVPARTWGEFLAHTARVSADREVVRRAIVVGGQVAGDIVLWRAVSGAREVGYRIGRPYWGKGIATAALAAFLAEFSERPLYAHVLRTNPASARVLEKCGFVRLPDGDEHDDDPEAYAFALR